MWDISLVYIGAVMLVVAIGFVFALRMGMSAALDADRQWAATPANAGAEVEREPAAAAAAHEA